MVLYSYHPSGVLIFIGLVPKILPSLRDCSTDLKRQLIRSGFTSKTAADILCNSSNNHPIFFLRYQYR